MSCKELGVPELASQPTPGEPWTDSSSPFVAPTHQTSATPPPHQLAPLQPILTSPSLKPKGLAVLEDQVWPTPSAQPSTTTHNLLK